MQDDKFHKQDKWKKFTEEQTDDYENEEQETPVREKLEYTERQELENQLTAMEQKFNDCELKVSEFKEKNLRLLAQMKNIQERAERDVEKAHKYGTEKLISDLLPVADSLVRGLESSNPEEGNIQSVREGMKLTLDLLHKTLTKYGVEIINPTVGDPFNPELQEAMSIQQAPDAKHNTILQVLQNGYALNGRVLRAAMVIVAS